MLKLRVLDLFFTEINVFVITKRVKYRKKVPLGTGTEFQVPLPVLVPVQSERYPTLTVMLSDRTQRGALLRREGGFRG